MVVKSAPAFRKLAVYVISEHQTTRDSWAGRGPLLLRFSSSARSLLRSGDAPPNRHLGTPRFFWESWGL